ncbi:MAG: glycosyltransferase family 4 protein [Ignavibacteriaceae bacterium]
MKVLIDDGMASLYNFTGIGQHGHNIFKYLKSYCDCNITNYWYLRAVPKVLRKYTYEGLTNIHSLYKKYNVIHYQNHNLPYIEGNAKRVVTIHDLSVYEFPETVPTIYVKHNQNLIKHSIEKADAIITPSEFTKEEIISHFPHATVEKIYSCETGLREIFLKDDIDSNILGNNHIDRNNYLFFLGSISKRKNLEFLINAFIKAKKNGAIKNDLKLVLGGQNWWGSSNIKKLINPQLGIIALGYLSDEDIVVLYRYSKAVIFPSIYEGFGIPIIEAMSQKVPLIISNIPTSITLNKRHGNQMLVFNLGDESMLIQLMNNLDKDYDSIKANLNYGDLSIYSYDRIAKKHFEVYKSLF